MAFPVEEGLKPFNLSGLIGWVHCFYGLSSRRRIETDRIDGWLTANKSFYGLSSRRRIETRVHNAVGKHSACFYGLSSRRRIETENCGALIIVGRQVFMAFPVEEGLKPNSPYAFGASVAGFYGLSSRRRIETSST